jgi:mediator of RNA polymerase II transcription subunit 17
MSSSDSVANITLRPYASSRKETLGPFELGLQLRQLVNAQGAHLRYITEASLQDEIESGKRVPKDDMEAEQTDSQQERSDAPTKEEQLRKLAETRDEMMRSVQYGARPYIASVQLLMISLVSQDSMLKARST